jgi:hypothetical protein
MGDTNEGGEVERLDVVDFDNETMELFVVRAVFFEIGLL